MLLFLVEIELICMWELNNSFNGFFLKIPLHPSNPPDSSFHPISLFSLSHDTSLTLSFFTLFTPYLSPHPVLLLFLFALFFFPWTSPFSLLFSPSHLYTNLSSPRHWPSRTNNYAGEPPSPPPGRHDLEPKLALIPLSLPLPSREHRATTTSTPANHLDHHSSLIFKPHECKSIANIMSGQPPREPSYCCRAKKLWRGAVVFPTKISSIPVRVTFDNPFKT